jgi:hypothetical protein
MTQDWECQFCEQTCCRKRIFKVHLNSKHEELGQPVGLSKTKEGQYGNRKGLLNQQKPPRRSSDSGIPYFTADSTEKLFLQPQSGTGILTTC